MMTPSESTLPPDPGEDGRATLQGIDADDDGVRDDVQIYIETSYERDDVRAALYDIAVPMMRSYTGALTEAEVLDRTDEMNQGIDCLFALVDNQAALDILLELQATVLNTAARIRASNAADALASGNTFLLPDGDASVACSR